MANGRPESLSRDIHNQAGYGELLRGNRDFRWLWAGQIISLLGDWFNTIALYQLVYALTGSSAGAGAAPLALGAVFITKMLPWALASPVAGLVADRLNRRRLMIGADLVRAAVVLGFLLVDKPGELYLLYLLTAAQVVVGSVFLPAKNASIPNITTPRELLTANALSSATWSVMLAVGAALGGFAVEAFGTQTVFLLDSATYLLSALFIYGTAIPQRTEKAAPGPLVRTALREIGDGFRHMRCRPDIGRMALAKATWCVAGGALVYMVTLLGGRVSPEALAAGIGVLFMARGIGTGIGPIVARAAFKDRARWPAVIGGCIVFCGVGYAAVGLVPWDLGRASLFVLIALLAAAHAASGANWVLSTVLLQERTADRYRGRVFGTEWLLLMGIESLSILFASVLLQVGVLELRLGFQLFAAAQVACGLLWLALVVPRERRAVAEP